MTVDGVAAILPEDAVEGPGSLDDLLGDEKVGKDGRSPPSL